MHLTGHGGEGADGDADRLDGRYGAACARHRAPAMLCRDAGVGGQLSPDVQTAVTLSGGARRRGGGDRRRVAAAWSERHASAG